MNNEALLQDTDEGAQKLLVKLARETPVWKKFRQVAAATEACRAFAKAGLKSRYPHAPEEDLRSCLRY